MPPTPAAWPIDSTFRSTRLDFQRRLRTDQDYFVDEYTAGRTPNPCVMCNNWLKFGKLCDYADGVGAEFVATGHYAGSSPVDGPDAPPALLPRRRRRQGSVVRAVRHRARRACRDAVAGRRVTRRTQIRDLAREIGLRVADKKDSQEICFVPDDDYAAFVRSRVGELDSAGEVVTTAGEVVGAHDGIEHFTIGQRKGLGVAFGEPRYVVRIDPDSRHVVIGTREQLGRDRFTVHRANWLVDAPTAPLRCQVKIRYLSRPVEATVTPLSDGQYQYELDEPQAGVAPGQAVVCYYGDRVLGGGWIE